MADLPPATSTPPALVAEVQVTAPRLAPSPAMAAFSVVRLTPETLERSPRLDEALRRVPGVELFRRTASDVANPTIQGLSLRSFAPSGAGRALVTLDGAPQNDPFGGWVIWSALPPESLSEVEIVKGENARSDRYSCRVHRGVGEEIGLDGPAPWRRQGAQRVSVVALSVGQFGCSGA